MNYLKIYNDLMNKRIRNPIDSSICKCQRHHIIPRYAKGPDDAYNMVNLTMREHYMAHLLLLKYYESIHTVEGLLQVRANLNAMRQIRHFNEMFFLETREKWNFKRNEKLYYKLKKRFKQHKIPGKR